MARKSSSVIEELVDVIAELLSNCPWWGIGVAFVGALCLVIISYNSKNLYSVFDLLLSILALLAVLFAAFRKANRKVTFQVAQDINSIRALTWREFEILVGEAYRRKGYSVSELGGNGPDGGIDLILRKGASTILVQCKQWRTTQVGVRPIREFYGVITAANADGGVFVTSGSYTPDAKDFASSTPIELLDGPKLAQLIADVRHNSKTQPEITATLSPKAPSATTPVITTLSTPPPCPSCGKTMLMRTAKKGSKVGSQFWGCPGFSSCKGTRPLV